MRRPNSKPAAARFAMPAAVVLLLALALLPARWLAWTGALASFEKVIVAPVSQPLGGVARWLSPADDNPPPDSVAALEARASELLALLRRERARNRELRETVQQLQQGLSLPSRVPIRQIVRPVIATQSDPSGGALTIRAGRDVGVTESTVATVRGTQLLGQVRSVSARTCDVLPITSRQHTAIEGAVVIEAGEDRSQPLLLECLLLPAGEGLLRGEVEFDDALEPAPGMQVLLSDDLWPKSAQFLVIGEVERVETRPDQQLRLTIVVRPLVDDLRRVSEVVLRIPEIDPPGEEPTP
jgi:hypothetical protein